MKYSYYGETIPHDQRKALNEKVLCLIAEAGRKNTASPLRTSTTPIQGTAASTGWNGEIMKTTISSARQKRKSKTASFSRRPGCASLSPPA